MKERDFRVVQRGEGKVVFGSTEAVDLYLETGDPLEPETLNTLRVLKSKSPVFGWMRKGWLGKHVPKDFLLVPEPEWSFIWARDQISEQSFTASLGSSLQFHLTVSTSHPTASRVLRDELQDSFFSLTQREEEDLKAALGSVSISRADSQLNLDLELTDPVLRFLGKKNGFNGALNWEIQSGGREGWQKVGDILAAAGIKGGDKVADVGAGGGFLSARLARVVGNQGRVWAVDINSKTLERVRRRAELAPYPQLKAVLGEVDDPGLPAGEFDAITVVNAYHEMEEHGAMLGHFREALKSGGRLVVVEAWNAECGSNPRGDQVKDHVLSPDLVESELEMAGFQIHSRKDNFTERGEWRKESLVVAVRP